jgi:chromosome segregation ATPase
MSEQDRRMEILKAEEAVRQLAQELARTLQSRSAADEMAERLRGLHDTLEQTRGILEKAVQAVSQTAQEAQAALANASSRLGNVETQLAQVVGDLRGAVQQLDGITPAVQRALVRLSLLVWLALTFAFLGSVGSVVGLVVLLLRKG